METLLVTVKNNQQVVASLVEILQAMNFVESVTSPKVNKKQLHKILAFAPYCNLVSSI
jgi:small nuclear ribonucleoprotein (snRNP)-like protein